ncbi:MAG: Cof-type HAD-IIB family hydrolase [Anaeroplasmataceae bacterium]|nr:Cof-type HAD-IIB family hydrolase [Anaeroplasmataceae bacterium]
MIKLCTIDLDGTLFDNQKKISQENKIAIENAKKLGCKIVIATGRPMSGVLPVLQELYLLNEDDYVICYNGAKILKVQSNEVIFASTLDGKSAKELYALSKKLKTNYHAFRLNEELITDMHNPYTDKEASLNKINDIIVDFKNIKDSDLFIKCMMVGSSDTLDTAFNQLPSDILKTYSVVRSSPIFLEFLNKNSHKGAALEILANHLGISMNETMAIGDAGNDLEMIRRAGIGVAMKNSFKEILYEADFITTSNEESGVAFALNHFLNK